MNPLILGNVVMSLLLSFNQAGETVRQGTALRIKPVYETVKTDSYAIQIPKGWSVSDETPWGSRQIRPPAAEGELGAGSLSTMTGRGAGRQSWDRLYQTSLYFIMRGAGGSQMRPAPYSELTTQQGYEACAWDMLDGQGAVLQRHAILRHSNGNILAVSVKFPKNASETVRKVLDRHFWHMVHTAKLHPAN